MNPVTEVSNLLNINKNDENRIEMMDSPLVEKRKVLEGMARIEVEIEPSTAQIFSFHYLYKEYLDYQNLIDVRI